MPDNELKRCTWCGTDELYVRYHDEEWGVPLYDDVKLFELINLEGAQAGLSWITVLKKRENYRKAFDNFDPSKIIKYNDRKISELLSDPGIIRNRLKINAVINNSNAFIKLIENENSFSNYLWSFTDNKPIINEWKSLKEIPSKTELSDKMSKDLKKRGFKFVGSTIIYAFLQAAGIVNDHTTDCFRYKMLN